MSSLSDLDGIVLRSVSHPPLTTKGSELTYAELDNHAVKLYDAVQDIVSGANVTAYDAGKTYDMFSTDIRDRYVGYNNRIWKAAYVGSPSTFSGQTPEEGIYWEQVALAEMLPNIMKLAEVSDSNGVVIKEATLTIASADVLTLHDTPLTIVSAISGKIIDPISATVEIDFNSVAYDTNVGIQLIQDNGGSFKPILTSLTALNASTSSVRKLTVSSSFGAADAQLLTNTDLQVYAPTGNPQNGNSDIVVRVLYHELDMS